LVIGALPVDEPFFDIGFMIHLRPFNALGYRSCLHALAVMGATRWEALPDVPTVGDFEPGFEASALQGIGASKDTPARSRTWKSMPASPTRNRWSEDLLSSHNNLLYFECARFD
jgi:Tripartite tricarboxylate transporter family receptor